MMQYLVEEVVLNRARLFDKNNLVPIVALNHYLLCYLIDAEVNLSPDELRMMKDVNIVWFDHFLWPDDSLLEMMHSKMRMMMTMIERCNSLEGWVDDALFEKFSHVALQSVSTMTLYWWELSNSG